MKSRLKPRLAASLLAAVLAAGSPTGLRAHDVEKGPNGGPMITAGDNHLELVAKGTDLVVYLSDKKHEPVTAKGASGRAIVQAGGKTSTIVLAPGEGNRLVGKAEAPIAAGARVVVSATLPGGPGLQARFVVK
jgi:hypothetical protein